MAAQLNLNTEKIEKIKARVEGVNEELAAQATTISEIAALLEGKSVPGGSGGSVETCTVEISAPTGFACTGYYYTAVNDTGSICTIAHTGSAYNATLENVVCDSVIAIRWDGAFTSQTENANVLWRDSSGFITIYEITATSGGTVTIINNYQGNSGN